MTTISILGSTGSIGTQALDVVRSHRPKITVAALSAHANIGLLKRQIREFRPRFAAVAEEADAAELSRWCKRNGLATRTGWGTGGRIAVATEPSAGLLLSAVVGAVGIEPLIAALRAGKTVALANKEALVTAGDIIMDEARRHSAAVIPVDSEHSAIFQCLKNEEARSVRRIILTASGGPFYRSARAISSITVDEALAHPTWRMGPKITIDSATLMNKGLEAIEAHHLFNVPMDRIDIVIHPQSIVHSLVEFVDGSVLAQLSRPDMRLPIQYALTYPGRRPSPVARLDLAQVRHLEFDAPDFRRFPCLMLALEAAKAGGTMPAAMNAANEVAVRHFLKGKISFGRIPAIIRKVMAEHTAKKRPRLSDILAADAGARAMAEALALQSRQKNGDSKIRS